MVYILVLMFCFLLSIEYMLIRNPINSLVIGIGPYIAITAINNIFCVRIGFFKISDDVVVFLLWSMLAIYMGIITFRVLNPWYKSIKKYRNLELPHYNLGRIKRFFLAVCLMRIAQLVYLYAHYGLDNIIYNDFAEFGLRGIVSHIFLMLYSLAPILFYQGIQYRDKTSIFAFGMGLTISMLSFIKYHCIFYILFSYIYTAIINKKLAYKLSVFCLGSFVVAFFGNYFLGFYLAQNYSYGVLDIAVHLWNYIGGSIINGNLVLDYYTLSDYTVSDFLSVTLLPLFNWVLGFFTSETINLNSDLFGFMYTNVFGSKSNVVGMLFYPLYSGGIVFHLLYCIIYGIVIDLMLYIAYSRKYNSYLMFSSIMVSIFLMTFFANYFGLTTIWEIILLSIFIPRLFVN